MFDLGSIASSVLDYADDAASAVLGGISTAGNWMQANPGAATLLGSALVAGGSYLENRDTLKRSARSGTRSGSTKMSTPCQPVPGSTSPSCRAR